MVDTCWMGVEKSTVWREITTPSSPYTVSEHDSEFLVEVENQRIETRNVLIIKSQLTPMVAKEITFAQNRVDNEPQTQKVNVSATLSSNERQFALTITGQASGQYSIGSVYAR